MESDESKAFSADQRLLPARVLVIIYEMFGKLPVLICSHVFAARLMVTPDPPLAFREDWKDDSAPSRPAGNGKLSNANLELSLYGPGKNNIDVVHSAAPTNDTYLSMGSCGAHCAFTLRDRNSYFDFTNPDSKIHWRTMQDGFYEFKVVLRLADGTWLISDHNQGGLPDWVEDTYTIKDYHWYRLDINTFTDGLEVLTPDFRKVDEIGCACSTEDGKSCADAPPGLLRLDWLEVYGALVRRG